MSDRHRSAASPIHRINRMFEAVGRAIRQECAIDRTDLTPVSRMMPAGPLIIVFVAIIIAAGLGDAIRSAVESLLGFDPNATTQYQVIDLNNQGEFARTLATNISWALLACLAMTVLRRLPAPACPHRPITPRTAILAYFVAFIPLALGTPMMGIAAQWTGVRFVPSLYIGIGTIPEMLIEAWSDLAGLVEEPLAVGLLAVGLRRCNASWVTIAAIATLLRISYHLYYGWTAIVIVLWPVLFVLLYRRVGSILPMILAHGTFNALASMNGRHPGIYSVAFLVLVTAGIIVVVGVIAHRAFTVAKA